MAGCLGRLGRIAGHVLGGGGHFLHGGGDLVDLCHLLVHALVGADRDIGGMLGGIADALHRRHHLGDHRLQLDQEGVEALGDGTEFVGTIAGQAAGQVAFALGDIVEHGDHLLQRPGDSVTHQPDHQQAQPGDDQPDHRHAEHIGLALVVQVALEFLQVGHHRVQRQLHHQGPAGIALADAEGQVQLDQALGLVDVISDFATIELAHGRDFFGIEDIADFLAELARVLGIGDQAAVGAHQGHVAGTTVEFLVGRHQHVLDEVHRQVGTDDALERAIEHDRLDKGGEHHHLVADLVRSRIDHAGLVGFLGAQVVLAGAYACGKDLLVIDIHQGREAEAAVVVAEPPGQEATIFRGPGLGVVEIGGIVVIQGVLFPADIGAEHFRVLLDVFLDQADQLLTADAQYRFAIGVVGADQRVDAHQAAGDQQRRFEFTLDLADLGPGQGVETLFDHLLELFLGALLHHVLGLGPG